MNENPYQPSLLPATTPALKERPGISILAIFLGVLTDIGGTFILGVVIGVIFAIYMLSRGANPDEIADQAQGTTLFLIGLVPGMCLTMLGGFVAGKVAGRSEILHGALTGVTSTGVGLLLQLLQPPVWWQTVVSVVLVTPLAILGSRLSMIGRQRRQVESDNGHPLPGTPGRGPG